MVTITPTDGSELIQADAVPQEQHSSKAEATRFPVEAGADITDHVRPQPDQLKIDGVITQDPFPSGRGQSWGEAEADAGEGQRVPGRDQAGYEKLRALKEKGTPCTIETTLRSYENMVLVGLDVTRDAATGLAVKFSADWVEIRTVASQSVPLPRSGAPGTTHTGKQAPKKVEDHSGVPDSMFKGIGNPSGG